MRCGVTMSTFREEIWKKPWREISFLFRVCRVLCTSGLFSWRKMGRGDQSNLARALSGTIDDVQMAAAVVVGGDQISWRKERRWELERCEEGGQEDAVKSLLLWHPNDMKWEKREGGEGEGGGAGVLMRDAVLFFSRGSVVKNCLRKEEVPCDVLRQGGMGG